MKTRHIAIIALSALLPCFAPPAAEAAHRSAEPSSFTPVADAASRTLELINRERSSAGLVALTLDDEVSPIAADWSRKIAADGALSHNGEYLSQATMQRLDASRVGENVAVAESVDEIHSMFMNSAPHRANILQADFRQIGIAAVRTGDGSIYLTEDFLTRRNPEGGAQPSPAKKSAERPKGKSASARKAPAQRAQRPQSRPNQNRTRARRR